jgi:hypothetical protein
MWRPPRELAGALSVVVGVSCVSTASARCSSCRCSSRPRDLLGWRHGERQRARCAGLPDPPREAQADVLALEGARSSRPTGAPSTKPRRRAAWRRATVSVAGSCRGAARRPSHGAAGQLRLRTGRRDQLRERGEGASRRAAALLRGRAVSPRSRAMADGVGGSRAPTRRRHRRRRPTGNTPETSRARLPPAPARSTWCTVSSFSATARRRRQAVAAHCTIFSGARAVTGPCPAQVRLFVAADRRPGPAAARVATTQIGRTRAPRRTVHLTLCFLSNVPLPPATCQRSPPSTCRRCRRLGVLFLPKRGRSASWPAPRRPRQAIVAVQRELSRAPA